MPVTTTTTNMQGKRFKNFKLKPYVSKEVLLCLSTFCDIAMQNKLSVGAINSNSRKCISTAAVACFQTSRVSEGVCVCVRACVRACVCVCVYLTDRPVFQVFFVFPMHNAFQATVR